MLEHWKNIYVARYLVFILDNRFKWNSSERGERVWLVLNVFQNRIQLLFKC